MWRTKCICLRLDVGGGEEFRHGAAEKGVVEEEGGIGGRGGRRGGRGREEEGVREMREREKEMEEEGDGDRDRVGSVEGYRMKCERKGRLGRGGKRVG